MVDFVDEKVGVVFRTDSITWGGEKYDDVLCTNVPSNGFYRRQNEQAVLPHAIACQNPTHVLQYAHSLQGWI